MGKVKRIKKLFKFNQEFITPHPYNKNVQFSPPAGSSGPVKHL